mgnify:CR=1 FL=1
MAKGVTRQGGVNRPILLKPAQALRVSHATGKKELFIKVAQELIPQVYFISPNFKYKITNRDSTIDIHPLRHNNFIRGKFGLGETDNPTPIYQPNADFVGKVENLEQDIKRLFDYLDVAIWSKNNVMGITKENTSKEKVDYREQYNTESVEIVQSIFQQDFEYFNYSYDLADSSSG